MTTSTTTKAQGGIWLLEEPPASGIFTPEQLSDEHRLIAQTTDEFVNRVLEKLMAHKKPAAELSPEERAEILLDWTANHAVGGPPLSDYAESRESIDKGRDDAQL